MKSLLLPSRRATRAMLRLLLIALLGMMAINSARATTTYSYSGSHQLVWTSNSSKYLEVTRTGGYDSLEVFAYLSGSTNFTLDNGIAIWPDTSNDTGGSYDTSRYFTVNFSSLLHDTSHAIVVLRDQHHSDTIYLTGYGTLDTEDFTIGWNEQRFVYGADTGSTGEVEQIWNHRSNGISVTATLSDSAYWKVDSEGMATVSLTGGGGANIQISYTPHGVWHDSVRVYFTCFSPYYEQRSVMVYVTDNDYAPQTYAPTVMAPNLGTIPADSSACGTAMIRNTTSQAITITGILYVYDGGGWSFSNLPSMPFSLAPGDSVLFTACLTPVNYYSNGYANNVISVSYQDSSGITGSATANATAQLRSCIQGIQDSLYLDEVLAGGYVEATAIFVMDKDTILSAATPYVSPGSSFQILSPTLPISVHIGDTVTFLVKVIPPIMNDSSGNGEINYYGNDMLRLGDCEAQLAWAGLETSNASNRLQLFQNETGLMALTTTNAITVDTFWFDNNYSGQVIVSNVALTNGTNFSILGEIPHAPADTLTPGNEMGVIIQFNGDTNGFYHDSLTVTTAVSRTEGKAQITSVPSSTHVFNLEAIRAQGSASVNQPLTISSASLSIVPNPTVGPVTISMTNAQKATVEIYDLLGNQVGNASQVSSFEWNPGVMANGIYIVRAQGIDVNGTSFVISKRLSLKR